MKFKWLKEKTTGSLSFYDSTGLSHRLDRVESYWAFLIFLIPLAGFAGNAPTLPVEEDIRGARGLIEIPEPPNYGLWVATALGAILLGFLIWKLATAKRKPRELTAAEQAMKELEKARSLIDEESSEPLANAVTDVVRTYLDQRFGVEAPRLTTEEFLADLRDKPNSELATYNGELGSFLRACDAVKFGRGALGEEARHQLIESARRFVEATKREPKPMNSITER